jgi:hypothetical protein
MASELVTGPGPYAHLSGYALPGARVEMTPHVAWLWAGCVTAPPRRDVGHPTTGWLLGVKGMGLSWVDLFALLDATPDSGVVLGEAELSFERELRVGERYDVSAVIEEVERRVGRRAGTLDRMRVRIELREVRSGRLASSVGFAMIFPRGEAVR